MRFWTYILIHGVDIEDIQLAGERYVPLFSSRSLCRPSKSLTVYAARELTLDAAQSARSSKSTSKPLPAAQVKKLLDSRNDREVLDGLRKVISVRLPL